MAIDISKLNTKQLNDLSHKLEERQIEIRKSAITKLRTRIEKDIHEAGFTIDDLYPTRRRRGSIAKRSPLPPKFRDPTNPDNTWSGRGKRPNWFKAALAKGKKEKDLLIKK